MALAAAFGLFAALYLSIGKRAGDNISNGRASFTAARYTVICAARYEATLFLDRTALIGDLRAVTCSDGNSRS
jgi:hypothetical protein